MSFESIHNYYEALVAEYISDTLAGAEDMDDDFLEDIACLALNRLPARYVRHDVDMAFFLTSQERKRMRDDVVKAVDEASNQVRSSHRRDLG